MGLRALLDRCGKLALTGIRSSERPARSESLIAMTLPEPTCLHDLHKKFALFYV